MDTEYVYFDDHIALALDGDNEIINRYLHGPVVDQILADEQVTSTSSPGEVLWPLTDNLGSVRDIIDSDGNVDNHITYDVFGNITSETATSVDHIFGYTGRERDEESDLYYNRARYYDPNVGRWTAEDPISFAAGDTNLSRYVLNAPTNLTDPSGLAPPARRGVDGGTGSDETKEGRGIHSANGKTPGVKGRKAKKDRSTTTLKAIHPKQYKDLEKAVTDGGLSKNELFYIPDGEFDPYNPFKKRKIGFDCDDFAICMGTYLQNTFFKGKYKDAKWKLIVLRWDFSGFWGPFGANQKGHYLTHVIIDGNHYAIDPMRDDILGPFDSEKDLEAAIKQDEYHSESDLVVDFNYGQQDASIEPLNFHYDPVLLQKFIDTIKNNPKLSGEAANPQNYIPKK